MSHSSYQSIPGLTVPSFFLFVSSIPSLCLFPFLPSSSPSSIPFTTFHLFILSFCSHPTPPPTPPPPPPLFLHLMYSFLLLYFLSHSFLFLPPFLFLLLPRRSLSLIQALLNITEQGYYSDVMNIFYVPMRQCPELLFLGIISSTVRFTQLLELGSMGTNDLYHFCIVLLHWPHTQATWAGNEATCYAGLIPRPHGLGMRLLVTLASYPGHMDWE